jgi:hypothetical protein
MRNFCRRIVLTGMSDGNALLDRRRSAAMKLYADFLDSNVCRWKSLRTLNVNLMMDS